MREIMTEARIPTEEFDEPGPLGEELQRLGDAIAEVTIGHDDAHLSGSFSRKVNLTAHSNMSLIFKEEGQAGIGPDIIIHKESIELVNDKEVLKSYVFRWPKDFPLSEKDQHLTIINPAAKKDKRRDIRGDNFSKYSKDMETALQLVVEAKEILGMLSGEA